MTDMAELQATDVRQLAIQRGLSAVLELPRLALAFLNEKAEIEFWNDAAVKLTGQSESEVRGRQLLDILSLSNHAEWNKLAAKVRRGRDVTPIECGISTSTGESVLVLISATAIHEGPERSFCGYVVHLKDVTRLAQEVQRARRSTAEIQAVVQTVPDGIISLTSNGIIQAFNPSAERLFGFRAHEALGCNVEILLTDPYKDVVSCDMRGLAQEKDRRRAPRTKEIFALRKDGSRFACEFSLARLPSEDVESAFVGVFRDISDRKEAEEKVGRLNVELRDKVAELGQTLEEVQRMQSQLVEAEKMASLGSLVAGVAHEINTPIGICLSASTLLDDMTKKTCAKVEAANLTREEFQRYLKTAGESSDLINRNIRRAADLVGAFKKTSVDRSQDESREFDLGGLLTDAITSVSPIWKSAGHSVELECPDGVVVFASAGAIVQILTNLISNAVTHGFKEGVKGVISIRASAMGSEIEIRVSDDGSGMAESVRKRIFEPFFTTNRAKGGTGLGLHVTFNLATQALGGSIKVNSTEGNGSEFLLRFPARLDKAKAGANDASVNAST